MNLDINLDNIYGLFLLGVCLISISLLYERRRRKQQRKKVYFSSEELEK